MSAASNSTGDSSDDSARSEGGLSAESRIDQLQRLLTSLRSARTNEEAEAVVGRMDADMKDKLTGEDVSSATVDKRFVTALRDLNRLQRTLKL